MTHINQNFLKLPGGYLFPEISRRVKAFSAQNPPMPLIKLGIGDVTLPLAPAVVEAMAKATEEMGRRETFRGYCEETGQGTPEGLGEMAMAIYNGLTEEYRKSIQYMEEITGKTVSCINMVGGGIQDQLLCELTAKKTGKRVMAGPVEGSVLGNSIVQMVATGAIGSVQEGREIIRRSFDVKIYEP